MSKHNKSQGSAKPNVPADFPLKVHPMGGGYWYKTVRGKFYYFGKVVDDPRGDRALNEWLRVKDDLYAGRPPTPAGGGFRLRDLLNKFLNDKRQMVESGELSAMTWQEYHETCQILADQIGKARLVISIGPDDFTKLRTEFGTTRGPSGVGGQVGKVKLVFHHALKSGWIPRLPVYGPNFKRPSQKVMREQKIKGGRRMLEPAELQLLLKASSPQMRAMILLAVNLGLGNADCGRLRESHLDLDGGWLDYPRPKTAVQRRGRLWGETVAALREVLGTRPKAKQRENTSLVFITKYGNPWRREATMGKDGTVLPELDSVSGEFAKLRDECGLKRPGISFYTLRHIFQTIGSRTRDEVAVSSVMGHAPKSGDMSFVYREEVDDQRLTDLANYVRGWLFGTTDPGADKVESGTRETAKQTPREVEDDPPSLRLFVG